MHTRKAARTFMSMSTSSGPIARRCARIGAKLQLLSCVLMVSTSMPCWTAVVDGGERRASDFDSDIVEKGPSRVRVRNREVETKILCIVFVFCQVWSPVDKSDKRYKVKLIN